MPKYKVNGKLYDIPEDKVEKFESKYPNATVEYHNEGTTYMIPLSKREKFESKYPNATLGVQAASVVAPIEEEKGNTGQNVEPRNVTPVQPMREESEVVSPKEDKASEMSPEEVQKRIRQRAIFDATQQGVDESIREGEARVGRILEPLTAEGREKLKAAEARARMLGAETTLLGLTPSYPGQKGEGGSQEQDANNILGINTKYKKPVAQSPVPYGVEYQDGKPVTQWLMPDGSITTNYAEADQTENEARKGRLRQAFERRMKDNGYIPGVIGHEENQTLIDAIVTGNNIGAKEHEAIVKAMKANGLDPKNSEHAKWVVTEDQRSILLHRSEVAWEKLKKLLARREQEEAKKDDDADFLTKLGRSAYASVSHMHPTPQYNKSQINKDIEAAQAEALLAEKAIREYDNNRKAAGKGWFGKTMQGLGDALTDINNYTFGVIDASVNSAVRNADITSEYGRRLIETAQLSQDLMLKAPNPGGWYSGSRFAGSMVFDPTFYLSWSFGGLAYKGAVKGFGKIVAREATEDVASRLVGQKLVGRMAAGAVSSAANLGTFELLGDMRQQWIDGGWTDSNGNFHEGFSLSHALGRGGHGAILGSVMGIWGAGVGNVADKMVKAIPSKPAIPNVVGKTAIRAGQVPVSIVGEGTIFAMPDIINYHSMSDDEFDKLYADKFGYAGESDEALRNAARDEARSQLSWDAWSESQAFIFGMKVAGKPLHAKKIIKTAGDRIKELKGADEREHRSFLERLSQMMDKSPLDVVMTREELDELRKGGYGELADLFVKSKKGTTAEAEPADRAIDFQRMEAEEVGTRREFDGYDAMQQLTKDVRISQSARAKAYFILTGCMLPMGTVTGYTKSKTAEGKVVVNSVTADGEVVTSRTFKSEKSAEQEVAKIKRQAELNSIDVGEKFANEALNLVMMEEVKGLVAQRYKLPEEAIEDIYTRQLFGERISEAEKQIVDDINSFIEQSHGSERYKSLTPEAMRDRIEEETGVNVDEALRKSEADRSEAENGAIKEYAKSLYEQAERVRRANNIYNEQSAEMRDEAWQMQRGDRLIEDGRATEIKESVANRTHKDNGVIIPATMKVGDRPVYIIKGDVVMFADGSAIDVEKSSESIVIVDAQTGEKEFVSPDQIYKLSDALNPHEVLSAELDAYERMMRAERDSEIVDNSYNTDETDNAGDVLSTGEGEGVEGQRRDYAPGDKIVMEDSSGNIIYGEIVDYDAADDRYVVDVDSPIRGGYSPQMSREELDGMVVSHNGESVDKKMSMPTEKVEMEADNDSYKSDETYDSYDTIDNGLGVDIPQESGAIEDKTYNSDESDKRDNTTGESLTVAPQESGENEPQSALSRIPIDEKRGEPMYESVDAETAWDAIVEQTEGDEAMAQSVVAGMVADKESALKKLEKAKSKGGVTIAEKIASEKERKAAIEAARKEVESWKRIADTYNRRIAEAEERRREQEAERRAAEQAEAARLKEIEAAEKAERDAIKKYDKELAEVYDEVKDSELALERLKRLVPETIDEAAAYVLSSHKLLWGSDNVRKGASSETGFGEGERRKLFGLFASRENGGKTIGYLSEDVMQEVCDDYGIPYDNMSARDALIELVRTSRVPSDITHYISRKRAHEAREIKAQEEAHYQAQEEEYYQERYHMSKEEYDAYEVALLADIENRAKNFDENEFYGNIADEKIEREKIGYGNGNQGSDRVDDGVVRRDESEGTGTRDVGGAEVLSPTQIGKWGRGEANAGGPRISGEVGTEMSVAPTTISTSAPGSDGERQGRAGEAERLADDGRNVEDKGYLTEDEADDLILASAERAIPMPMFELTSENWKKEFGDGTLETPIEQIKIGVNQFSKMIDKGREKEAGLIKPTFTDPDFVIEEASIATYGTTERASSHLYVKSFIGKDGKKRYFFKSVTVKRDGLEVNVSSHFDRPKRLREALKNGKLLYRFDGGAQTEQIPASVSVTTSRTNPGVSTGKDIEKSHNSNELGEKSDVSSVQGDIEGFEGYSREEVKKMVLEAVSEKLSDVDVEILGLELHGSRSRGGSGAESDLDAVVEYSGDFKEDAVFNLLHDDAIEINGVVVDVNPIRKEESGTLADYMERSRGYDAMIRSAEAEVNTNPTEAQKEAGNYKKGHVQIRFARTASARQNTSELGDLPSLTRGFGTFNITIEQPKGYVRRGVDANGKEWATTMQNTYGYIRGTEGVDGDHIDVFLSDDIDGWNGRQVYVVDQRNDDGSFDEHKVMLGFNDINDAESAYMSNYEEGWQGLGAITGVSIEEFEKWIGSSHRKTKAFAEYKSVKSTEVAEKRTEDKTYNASDKGEAYTIAPAQYTTKRGKVLEMQLVKFSGALTKEQQSAAKEFARAEKGWWDREQGGFMMRSEESAKQLVEMMGNEESVADNQPLTAEDYRKEVSPVKEPKKSLFNRVDVEGLFESLRRDGEATLSAHAEPIAHDEVATGSKGRELHISEDMKRDEDVLRDILGIGEQDIDNEVLFRDSDELTPEQKRKVYAAGVNYSMGYIEQGIVQFEDFARAMTMRLGGKIKPWIKSFYEGVKRIPGYEDVAFTPSDEVDRFDVEGIDKPQSDLFRNASLRAEEQKVDKASAQAREEIKENRNDNRKKEYEQTTANTVALAEEAGVVASEARSVAEATADREELNRVNGKIDKALDDVNNQLALLGYYEADLDDSKFHEMYGYMLTAEKKAVNNATELAKQLVKDLGLDFKVTSGTTPIGRKTKSKDSVVRANVAPAGGDVAIRLPLREGKTLAMYIGLDPADKGLGKAHNRELYSDDLYVSGIMYRIEDAKATGSDRYGSNMWAPVEITYGELLRRVKEVASEYLPVQRVAETSSEKKIDDGGYSQRHEIKEREKNGYKVGEEVWYTRHNGKRELATIVDFGGGADVTLNTGLAPIMYECCEWSQIQKQEKPATESQKEIKGASAEVEIPKSGIKKRNKKVVTLKPEQTMPDLFGGLFAEPNKADAELHRQFAMTVKADMLAALDNGTKPYRSILDLRKRASELGMEVDSDGRTDILLQELVEDGLVRAAREVIGRKGRNSRASYDLICKLYEMQPTIAARSSNRIKMQQYSTPLPMAWIANHFAMANKAGGKVLEPTAGNGMLVFTVPVEQVHANELDETRLENLREQGFAEVTQQDATEPFEGGMQYDVVIANPPFGKREAVEYDGKMIPGLDPQITLNALASMKNDGRAAIIIGGNMEYASNGAIKSMKPFFTYLYDHYNVKGVIDMSGGLYAKQGTTFPTRMILIDGRRSDEERAQTAVYPPVGSKAIRKAESFDDLYEIINEVLNSKEKTNGTEILRSRERQLASVNNETSGDTDGAGHREQPRKNDDVGSRRKPTKEHSDGSEQVLPRERRTNNADGETRAETPRDNAGGSRSVSDTDIQRVGTERVSTNGVGLKQTPTEHKKRTLTDEKSAYRPHNSAFSLNSVAPAAMVEAMDNVLTQIEAQHGSIDEFIRTELGYDTVEEAHQALAAEQMDSVAMAIYQMKQGQALIIGDQTGVGKGRQMASLIRWAVQRGEKPVFITQKADLFSDIYRDLVDVGSGDLVPFIFNSDGAMVDSKGNTVHKPLSSAEMAKVFASGTLPDEYDFAVLTYSQVNTGDAVSQQEMEEAAKKSGARTKKSKNVKNGKATPKATFLRAIAEDNYLFLDESHTAAGSSNTGAYLQSILRTAKAATFASATFAKRPDTMPLYAIRTAMSQAKVEPDKMISIIEKGGVTLQEIMSRELTNAGQMVRRERDMSDVITDWKTITDPEIVRRARENYDRTISAFNAIIKFQEDYVKPMIEALDMELAVMAESAGVKRGTDKMGVENVPFASKTYNYTKQLMLALKVDAIADEVEAEINAGRHPVIALESTMESSIKDYAAGEIIDEPTFSASLLKGLDTVMQYTVKDEDGNERHERYSPQALGPAGEKAYYELQDFIRESTSDIFISPLDAIIERLHEKGYKVGELTGRNMYVERNDDGRVVVKRRTDKDKKRMQREFNSGVLDVLILNKSASTGISLHASEKFSDQRQRSMIIAQPLSDINDYMQMIGRIDRTGQVHRGYYINLGLPVPAENRFLMMLSTKLKSLNANTTTSQDSESNDVEAPDLLNKYGSQVVVEYLRDNVEIYEKMGTPLKKGGLGGGRVQASELDEYKPQEDDARKVTGYVALLTTKEQEEFYDDVVRRYNELIKYLNDTGSNDLKINVMPLRAKTIERRVSSEGIDPNGSNPFARNSFVEKVEMDVLRKPMKADDIRKVIEQINRGIAPAEYLESVIDIIRKEDEARIVAEEERYEKAKAKAVEDIAKQTDKINGQKKRSEEEKRVAIENFIAETNEKVEAKHNDNILRLNQSSYQMMHRLRMFEVGKSYLVPDNLESMIFDFATPAIFCGYKTKESKITASTTLAVFATLDGRRRIEIKLSQIDALRSIDKMTNDNWDAARATTLDNWDSQIPSETRKTGFIMTGNILQAIADTQDEHGGYPGQLISYTDIDGNVHDGILMPDKWNASMLKTSGAPLSSRLQQIKDYMPITSHDGKVEIMGSRWAKMFYLTIPKTKKDGAVYYENKTLLRAAGGNFYPYRGQLRADIPADRIDEVVKELTKLGVKVKEERADDDTMYRTSEEIEADYPNWLDGTTTESGKHSTQVEGTRKTYNKVGTWIEANMGKDVSILDASSGMGYGTRDLRERGFNIDDVEPYQSEERKLNNPATYSSYSDIDKRYDYIISNAVLNVIPDDWRSSVLQEMVGCLNPGGKLFINTRKAGEEKSIKDKIELDSPREVLVKRNGKIASYQRFFTPQELKEWVEGELGEGYSVEVANNGNSGTHGLAAVVVTKNNESPANSKTSELGLPISNHKGMENAPVANVDAKVAKNIERAKRLDEIVDSIKGSGKMGAHEFLHEVSNAMVLGGNMSTDNSRYAKLGGGVTLRISDHYGNVDSFAKRSNQHDNYGLVIKLSPSRFKSKDDVDYLEYVYFPDKLTRERQLEILEGLKSFMKSGRYELLPTPDKVHGSGKFKDDYSVAEGSVAIKEARVAELSEALNTPIRVISGEGEVAELPSRRRRSAKGWYDREHDEVVVVLPNNVDVADVENTVVHEVVGHKGLRELIGEERFGEFVDEVYEHATEGIRRVVDGRVQRMVDAEADRVRVAMAESRERVGEDANAYYYADMAEARVKAEEKRGQYRREATEEYMADMAGKIGEAGFEKMSREEQTLWGRIKAKVQKFLDAFLRGLKISKRIKLGDKDLAYILFKSWKHKRGGGVFAEAEEVVMREGTSWDESEKRELAKIEEANKQFNEQLHRYVNGEMATKEYIEVSKPLGVMKKFLSNAPIIVRQRVLRKASATKHNVELTQLQNLPEMLAEPIFIFQRDATTLGVLTELQDRDGKNICVAIELNRLIQSGSEILEVNDIRSVHGRDAANIILPIAYNNTLKYVDKEKGLAWLSSASSNYQQEITKQDLDTATKVINDVEKSYDSGKKLLEESKKADEELGEEGVIYRDGDPEVHEREIARWRYEERVKSGWYQTKEALQDSMLGLKEAMLAIAQGKSGRKVYIEDIAGFENAYLGENRLSSVNQAEADAMARLVFKPMLKEISRLAKGKKRRAELTDYMMAKHGLERNAYMREQARANDEETERDFAGLTALTGIYDYEAAELEAQRMVDEYEMSHDTRELWKRVNAVSDAILSKSYECGLMSKETYEKVSGMYDYYIPLRGFDEKTSGDAYAYLLHKGSAFNAPIKKAEGRSSKADDPIVYLQSMAENVIMQGNRNKLVKQRFLNFVMNHPSDLASVSDLWIRYNSVKDEWEPVFPDNIDVDDTAEEVERKMALFEEKMSSLSELYPDEYKRGKETVGIPYRVVDSREGRQHQIVVKRNGRDYVITINGNPRAAQAVNGLTNPDNNIGGAIGAILQIGTWTNRQLSKVYTTRNPDFVVSNFIRDMLYSNSMMWVRESPNYALRYHMNYARVNPVVMRVLLYKYNRGTLDMSDKTESMFYHFMMNGGETGYVNVRDIEKHRTDIERELGKHKRRIPVGTALSLLGKQIDNLNRSVENCARFAAFVTSREMGRSVDRSIYDAKEVSVNFNKKGSGDRFYKSTGQTHLGNTASAISGGGSALYVFWKAAIQGTTNFGRQVKRHPIKALMGMASMYLLGALVASLGADDDDEKNGYYNLPEYVRRSNIVFKAGDSWISIPLPIEYRALYGMGELMVSTLSGKERKSDVELAEAILGQATQVLPLDFMEGGGGMNAFVPSGVKPIWEAYVAEKSWTGLPLYKDTPYNKQMPEWTKAYSSANKHIVGLTAALNEASGGDKYTKGSIDINPAKVEYMLSGYLGGYFNTANRLVKTAETIFGEREYDPHNVLLLNRLVKRGDERTEYRAVNNDYFKVKEEYEKTKQRLKGYEHDTGLGIFDYAEKMDFIYNSPEYTRYLIFEAYQEHIAPLTKELKDVVDEDSRKELESEINALKEEMLKEIEKTYGEEGETIAPAG